MRLGLVALVLAPLTASAKPAWRPPSASTEEEAAAAAANLASAIRTRDVRGLTTQLSAPFTSNGMWFPDAACTKRFATPGVITSKDTAAFARCLTTLRLQLSTRRSALRDGAVLTADPGIELEVAFSGAALRWIGFPTQTGDAAATPMLTAQAFEALRTAGTTLLDAKVAAELDGEVAAQGPATAWFKVCLDAKGAVTRRTAVKLSSVRAGEVFGRAIADWAFRPFEVRGRALPVCSLALLTYPSARAVAIEVLPPSNIPLTSRSTSYDFDDDLIEVSDVFGPPPTSSPSPPPKGAATIPPSALERLRLTGRGRIDPDATTQRQLKTAGRLTATASMKVCIDVRGKVSSTSVTRSSGYPAWDAKLGREARTWTFKPYQVANRPTAACATLAFAWNPNPTILEID